MRVIRVSNGSAPGLRFCTSTRAVAPLPRVVISTTIGDTRIAQAPLIATIAAVASVGARIAGRRTRAAKDWQRKAIIREYPPRETSACTARPVIP
ncbi:hypothetical protein GCM10009102_06590 [Sphingomonas insulae]|uniref:Uncharacterized protein n=1 Tax=Sphingomonas insulae TaxID=424800 RepID=A0ABN1HNM6_9SPHN